MEAFQDHNMRDHVTGDFNGDGFTDAVLHDGVQMALYVAGQRDVGPPDPITGVPPRFSNRVLNQVWTENKRFSNPAGTIFWRSAPHDIIVPGDFNGDGMDDLYVINLTWPYLTA